VLRNDARPAGRPDRRGLRRCRVVLTDLERRILALASERRVFWNELPEAVGVSAQEAESAAHSLSEKRLLLAFVPLGGPGIHLIGGWEITPQGRDVLGASHESL
jgi:uncharacterized protein YlxW (UPF0749 family)